MARKAYFSSRWQVETGSYLLLAGAIIFIFCQRVISDQEKLTPVIPAVKPGSSLQQKKNRKYLLATASVIFGTALIASFILHTDLPGPSGQAGNSANTASKGKENCPKT